jgi:hypothetical protein
MEKLLIPEMLFIFFVLRLVPSIYSRLALNLLSFYLNHPSAGITGMHHHTQLSFIF